MARNQVDCDLTIVEILRDGGMDATTASQFIAANVNLEDRWALCEALEGWELRAAAEKARLDAVIETADRVLHRGKVLDDYDDMLPDDRANLREEERQASWGRG